MSTNYPENFWEGLPPFSQAEEVDTKDPFIWYEGEDHPEDEDDLGPDDEESTYPDTESGATAFPNFWDDAPSPDDMGISDSSTETSTLELNFSLRQK